MRNIALLLVLPTALLCAESKARNIILFLGDAGGLSTLNAASLHGHGKPQSLYIQRMPHVGLMDTSAADNWVTDSAAGMSAIVTGVKTNNGVISQAADAVRGKRNGTMVQTIVEAAEERGLSTGVITNMSFVDATPAACYSHSNDRKSAVEIFAQLLKPRFGDGVDVAIGGGKTAVYTACENAGLNVTTAAEKSGYTVYASPDAVDGKAKRVLALTDSKFALEPALKHALDILSRNPKGYFLMVEWDMHTNNVKKGLENVVEMDNAIRNVANRATRDTLIVFAADHSFDVRLRGGKRGAAILPDAPAEGAKPAVRVEDGHTGEEVVVAAQGPGSERVRGFFANTDLHRIMLEAFGWKAAARPAAAAAE